MACGWEVFPDDFSEEPGRGPDADSRHTRQDRVKRVRLNDLLDLEGDVIALLAELDELLRKPGKHERCRVSADHGHGLLIEGIEDLTRPDTPFSWGMLAELVLDPFHPGPAQQSG